ncbi:MAG: ABC transporter substrate-binding protein [Halobacteria archaeon]
MDYDRRRFVKKTGAAAGVTALAGCMDSSGGENETSGGDTKDNTGSSGEEKKGKLPVGTILPVTGKLKSYGGGMKTGVDLAAEDVNGAGGVAGRELNVIHKDSETNSTKAVQKYNSLVNEDDVVGFVGAASSGVTLPLAENVASDQVMEVSPASTSPVLAEKGYIDGVKYFGRTAPNDGQQGIVMGRILNKDDFIGAETAAFLYINNPYGKGLAKKAEEAYDGEVVGKVAYNPDTTNYRSTLDKLFENDPDAVGFVGYPDNGKTIMTQWNNGGYGGDWVLSEGLNSESDFIEPLGDVLNGMYIASPDPKSTTGAKKFEKKVPKGKATLFSEHSYDAMMLMALAMEKAGEVSGTAIARNIRSVSRPPGEKVTVGEFEKAKDLLSQGKEINYQGASSAVNLNDKLEPLNPFAIIEIKEGEKNVRETIPQNFFEGKL